MRLATFVAIAVLAALALAGTSGARSSKIERLSWNKKYWHFTGVVHFIGNHARITQYHPNPRVRRVWILRLAHAQSVRHEMWAKMHPKPKAPRVSDDPLYNAFMCIHRYEGAWNAETGNGFHGGLQMDSTFQSEYGPEFVAKWGSAGNWPAWAQLTAAYRAYRSGRGFYPWPNTARYCGLI